MITLRKHNPDWQDNTRKKRALKRQSQDDAWATRISSGKYPTLRRLMTAIHKGEVEIALTINQGHYFVELHSKKGKQS